MQEDCLSVKKSIEQGALGIAVDPCSIRQEGCTFIIREEMTQKTDTQWDGRR